MQLNNHTFMITGGASGLGAAAATLLADAGAQVALVDLNGAVLQQRVEELGERARGYVADIADEQQAAEAVAAAQRDFGGIHGLVNCAGIAPGEKILGRNGPHALASFDRALRINLLGSFNMLRLVAEVMAQGGPNEQGERGVIINTASVAAYDGQIGQAAYAASKGGIVSMTLPAARELARHGIRVMTIAPGIFETPMMAGMTQEVRDSLARDVPFPPRLGMPEEYAALVRHIIENPMLNGEVIRLDGALRMAAR
ncbi:MAG TPA: SDR family NAD(P)-dependent oxidoreductase [Candidatus Pseudomonas excrementavium]|uniref:SDR family NAD(P)-dependent oxidoreductase n=1 Tax=Halopseudomonas bauzanensis TaxID=653930 RepID=UPI001C3B6879|nr:SDR family NAD(P)-dependent oxidoreductase [Halopseudomonas bauzanensis]HIZ49783.1 SDR family NAD(P)-dependent oxidoreductase [Candidatus Pseudomonas excrementavium]